MFGFFLFADVGEFYQLCDPGKLGFIFFAYLMYLRAWLYVFQLEPTFSFSFFVSVLYLKILLSSSVYVEGFKKISAYVVIEYYLCGFELMCDVLFPSAFSLFCHIVCIALVPFFNK